jgi:Fe-S oxidoreductase
MTTTHDPGHPSYLDEADVRGELTRVFDVCHSCRRCVDLCTSFPTLFEMIDRQHDRQHGGDAGLLTPVQQDQVVDECFQCKLCYVGCPYVPGLHEWQIDVPRLMLRADAMRHAAGQKRLRQRMATHVLGRPGLVGKAAVVARPLVNGIVDAPSGSRIRTVVAGLTGVSAQRMLPPFAKQRFSTWFRKRTPRTAATRKGTVTVFPTCLVEYHETQIGKDLVRVYERNGIECANTAAGCCGAPWLHAGNVEHFTKVAAQNVRILADEVRAGGDIVVPQPTCSYVLSRDYVDYVGGPDAELVATHTHDAAEYLMRLHTADDTGLDTDFRGEVPETITHHVACHLRAQDIGWASRDLMRLTGAEIELVQQCSGGDGAWGLRAENDHISIPIARALAERITAAGGGRPGNVVTGDCGLANTAIVEQTGLTPVHPMQVIARAYGIPVD